MQRAGVMIALSSTCLAPVAAFAADGDFVWARGMGGTSYDEGRSIAVDSAGNVYTTGVFQGTADIDPGTGTVNLTSAGTSEIFVQKLDATGSLVWARGMGGLFADIGLGIAVDGAGNVYITGFFQGTVDFDPGPGMLNLTSAGDRDIFVQKLDTSGDFVWARRMGGTSDDDGRGIAVDSAGNVYTTGIFQGTADFDPGSGTVNLTSAGDWDFFVQKLDTSGSLVWARGMGGTNYDEGRSIAVDGAGNVYITGFFQNTVDFDPGPGIVNLTGVGSSFAADIFVQKLDASGNFVWARRMGGSGGDAGYDIAVDGAGNVYTTGSFSRTADFDPGPGTVNLTSAGGNVVTDIFVQKLDASGSLVWARRMGGTNFEEGRGIVVDSASNVYTTGHFSGTADFDPGPGTLNLTSETSSSVDTFVQKLDASGTFVWARGMGGTSSAEGNGIAMDSSGNLYITGHFFGTADFDPGMLTENLTSAGRSDIFVQKLSGPDTTPPVINNIAIDPAEASVGDPLAITFDVDEALVGDPVVTVNDTPATIQGGKASFAYVWTIPEGTVTGPLDIEVQATDLTGNTATASAGPALTVSEDGPPAPGVPLTAWPAALALLALGGLSLRRRGTMET